MSNSEFETVRNNLDVALARSFIKPEIPRGFSASAFFTAWFQDMGSAYYFLFKKNLRVTNIQFAELLSLIRVHTTLSDNSALRDIQFLSRAEFTIAFASLVEGFDQEFDNPKDIIASITEHYLSLINPVIVLESFFGSCAVFIPPHLKLDIRSVCAESGYIHSCGRNVYTRNVQKAEKKEFFESLSSHLTKHHDGSKKILCAPYAHEDFTEHDREQASDLKDGLDDVKVYLEKFHMGSDSLVSVFKDMLSEPDFVNRLVVPEAGPYKDSREKIRREEGDNLEDTTIWLVVDRSVSPGEGIPGSEKFYICYEQEYRNHNPFHIFDENKPAWIAHTTIPHTLAGAMINISRPWWPSGSVLVADPFVGTGTTYIECLKFPNVDISCSDLEPVSSLLVKDNLEFFAMSAEDITDVRNRLKALIGEKGAHKKHSPKAFRGKKIPTDEDALDWALDFSSRVHPNDDFTVATFTREIVDELDKKEWFDKFLFYLTLRTTIRGLQGIYRVAAPENDEKEKQTPQGKDDETPWWRAFKREAESIDIQLGRLERLSQRRIVSNDGIFTVVSGDDSYSTDCSIDCKRLKNEVSRPGRSVCIREADARVPELLDSGEAARYDVIITDPPYGFNTNENASSLAALYACVIRNMINALSDDGQLVICLPERSHTGRRSLYFTHKQIVTQQIFSEAENAGREVLYSAFLVPPPSNIFRPPYYWESERALRRSILHFRLRKTSTRPGGSPTSEGFPSTTFDIS